MINIALNQSSDNLTKRHTEYVVVLKESFGPLWALMAYYLVMLAALSFSRLALILWQAERTLTTMHGYKSW